MRIAQVAPVWFPVPPIGYGGIELVVSLLADGLADRGHDVTLFASGGSVTTARLVSPMPDPPDPALLSNPWFDAHHAMGAYRHAGAFDLIHDHSGVTGPALGALLGGRPPVVHTLHGPWNEPTRLFYGGIQDRVHLVAISEAQRALAPEISYAGTVHNGINVDSYPLVEHKEPFLVYIGRANPEKGPTWAVEVARRAGMPLVMIVKRNEPFELAYWDEHVAPLLTDDVEVLEDVSHAVKVDLLGRAQAMIFPIQWPEPFGLVMTEAMACGTPVIACPVGAAEELIDDGVTGFLRSSLDELAQVVASTAGCSPVACRERVDRLFSAATMVTEYERIYAQVTGTP
jgi:glycosyltransferase involved in cell wall biosynthesis